MNRQFSIFVSGILFFYLTGFSAAASAEPPDQLSVKSPAAPSPSASPVHHEKKEVVKPVPKPKQYPAIVTPDILQGATNTTSLSIMICLTQQRAYLMVDGKVAIDTPISSGRKVGMTPVGEFSVLERETNHESNLYGDFVDKDGDVVRKNVNAKTDKAPKGTHFRGAKMKYFLRLTPEGVGMHVGILPGYPASHGCIRLPASSAELLFKTAIVKTPVTIVE